jgi:sodium-independent sulfate anion transporter 11
VEGVDTRPTLKAIVLDFTTVNHVDLTSIQVLTDVRTQIDRYASPDVVQFHFANVNNGWTKRALAAAGFGTPTPVSPNGELSARARIFAVGDMDNGSTASSNASNARIVGTSAWDVQNKDVELDLWNDPDEITATDGKSQGTQVTTTEYATKPMRLARVQGANYPFFHADLNTAYESAEAFAQS